MMCIPGRTRCSKGAAPADNQGHSVGLTSAQFYQLHSILGHLKVHLIEKQVLACAHGGKFESRGGKADLLLIRLTFRRLIGFQDFSERAHLARRRVVLKRITPVFLASQENAVVA
jgi:hypothetical protein